MLRFLIVPVLLAVAVEGSLVIYPEGASIVHDLTSPDSSVLIFSCLASGKTSQEADLKWFDPNNNEISKTGRSRIFIERRPDSLALVITNPKDGDGGVYSCKGTIDGVEAQATKILKIYKGIRVLSDKTQYIVNGTNDKVWCKISSSGEFPPSISWYKISPNPKGNDILNPITDNDKFFMYIPKPITLDDPPYLEIRNVSLSDQHRYLCSVNVIRLGKFHSHYINVIVTVPPTFKGEGLTTVTQKPVEGDRLELTCKAEGIPTPLYNFVKYSDASRQDEEQVVVQNSTDGYHVIDKINRTHEGLYECMAFNQGGSQNVSVEIDVQVPPTIEEGQNVTLEEGKDVRLLCTALGDPAPRLSWHQRDPARTYGSDPMQEIFVEEETKDQEMDEELRVYRRTLALVIPGVRPQHTGQYICEARNSVGLVKDNFHVEVDFKPVFGDKVDSHFYGWVGSNTNLTCKAKGNPLPVITWFKDNVQLKKDDLNDISEGDTDVPYQVVSYLTPKVDDMNQGTVFGAYTCEAKNDLGKNQVELMYNLAVVPEAPEAEVLKDFPTAFKLELQRPLKEGGQVVTHFIISYVRADEDGLEDPHTLEVVLEAGEDSVETELTELTPNTEYVLNITAVNNVGPGQITNLTATTADYSKPGKVEITSDKQGDNPTSFTLSWKVPMTGGADIHNYLLEYAVVEKVNTTVDPWHAIRVSSNVKTLSVGGTKTSVSMKKLSKDTYYQVKIKAVNRIGPSEISTFIIKTSKGDQIGHVGTGSRVQASAAALLLVTMATACLHPGF